MRLSLLMKDNLMSYKIESGANNALNFIWTNDKRLNNGFQE
jgi:hypothetical protein